MSDYYDDDIDEFDEGLEGDELEGGEGAPWSRERQAAGGRRFAGRARRSYHRDLLSQISKIDYKDYEMLRNFLTDRGKIRPRRQTGVTAKQQRAIARAIKRARHLALLPFHSEHIRLSGS